jgi:hypothetical protein
MTWPVAAAFDLLLVCVGLSLEVVFTALSELQGAKDWRLMGYTYVWMIPIYALIYPALCVLYPRVGAWPFYLRGVLYVGLIYIVEYAGGWLIRRVTGECPWEKGYHKARWGVHGLIRLDFAPAWLGAAFLFESVFRLLRGL